MKRAAAVLLALALVGSVQLTFGARSPAVAPVEVEARLAALAPGSTGGLNASDASASLAGTLLSTTTYVLHLNNTNATGAWHVKLEEVGASGVGNLVTLTVGVHNGTAATAQVTGALGALTQTSGAWVRLDAGASGRIYVTQAVSILGPDAVIPLRVYAADDATGDAYVVTAATLTIT